MSDHFQESFFSECAVFYNKTSFRRAPATFDKGDRYLADITEVIDKYWHHKVNAYTEGELKLTKLTKKADQETPFIFFKPFEKDGKKYNLLTYAIDRNIPLRVMTPMLREYSSRLLDKAFYMGAADKKTISQIVNLYRAHADLNIINPENGNNVLMQFFSKPSKPVVILPTPDARKTDLLLPLVEMSHKTDLTYQNKEGKSLLKLMLENGYHKEVSFLCKSWTAELEDSFDRHDGSFEKLGKEVRLAINAARLEDKDLYPKDKKFTRTLLESFYRLHQGTNGTFAKMVPLRTGKREVTYPFVEWYQNTHREMPSIKEFPDNCLKERILETWKPNDMQQVLIDKDGQGLLNLCFDTQERD